MKVEGYRQRYRKHKAMMERMNANGSLHRLYQSDKKRWSGLHRRLGYLEQASQRDK